MIGLIKNKGQNTQREPYPGSASDVNIDEIHTICGALTKLYMTLLILCNSNVSNCYVCTVT